MDKKDIYEHLAKIYLDASSKKVKKTRGGHPKLFKNILLIGIPVSIFLSISLFTLFSKSRPFNSQITLVLLPDAAKINFNFDPAKKETYSLDLKKLNLSRFRALGFSVKKTNYQDPISLRIEFINSFKEKSEVYLKTLPPKWQDFKIALSEFKKISDWSEITNLTFTVEEWNVRQKKGVVYIDNVRLLK
ncbi:MAG: hypothetical protein PHT41_06220 [Candidatus Omnitrophica bacterium]|nr:hypothetical protein [Candidatus Omnitrophota bacterium]